MHRVHYEIMERGVSAWNEWRKTTDGERPDLSKHPLSGQRGKQFDGWDFSKTDFSAAELSQHQFSNCDFSSTNFRDGILHGCSFQNCNFLGATLAGANLTEASFTKCNFNTADGKRARLQSSTMQDCTLIKANLDEATLSNSQWSKVLLTEVSAAGASWTKAKLDDCDFTSGDLRSSIFQQSTITSVRFISANLTSAAFQHARFTASDFARANLNSAQLSNSHCAGISFVGADLSHAQFSRADLSNANLGGCVMNRGTKFDLADVGGCKIDRFSLECLSSDRGQLTIGDMMRMEIHDPIAELSASYSGFTQWIHMAALTLFIAPYVWFLLERWTEMQAIPSGSFASIPLWEALARYVVNGGEHWRTGWFPNFLQLAFVSVTGLYNILRFMLLWKTKKLELRQQITGLPTQFSLSIGFWATAFKCAQIGFWFNLAVVLFHTIHFLRLPVPVFG